MIRDVNDDGRDDFVLHANRSYAILDVNQISSLDFGYGESFDSGETAKLNGENGFAAPRNSTFLDVNRDGLVDELRFGRKTESSFWVDAFGSVVKASATSTRCWTSSREQASCLPCEESSATILASSRQQQQCRTGK